MHLGCAERTWLPDAVIDREPRLCAHLQKFLMTYKEGMCQTHCFVSGQSSQAIEGAEDLIEIVKAGPTSSNGIDP